MRFVTHLDRPTATAGGTGNAVDILNKNALTTAGVLVGGSTAIAAGALVTAALPVQMVTAATVSAGLIYAGDRQAKGLPINPWAAPAAPLMSDDTDHTAGVDVEPAAA